MFRTKYGSKSVHYNGRKYDSRLEGGFAMWLDSLLATGKLKSVTPQYKIDLTVNGHHIANHFVDFFVILPNGQPRFVEAKGFETDTWRMKRKLVEALYPDIPYLVNPQEKTLLLR